MENAFFAVDLGATSGRTIIGTLRNGELELEELKTAIAAFLQELPERDRNIFLRRYFYLEDTAAIARRYVLRQANVRLILSRTRQKLKDFLQKEGLV